MFETASRTRAVDDSVSCAEALVASIAEERRVLADRFARVAEWADFHHPEDDPALLDQDVPRDQRLAARAATTVGAEGTPCVTRAGVVELGMLLQTSTGSAQALMRDVLELRHRLPAHWAAVQSLEVEPWKARQVAVLTHRLTEAQARKIDAQVLEAVTALPWGRAKDVVEAKVIAVDPAAHAARLAEEENRRFVSTRRRSNVAGLRTMIARGHAGDIARLEAMIAHLATLLEAAGDTSHVDLRRAKALAMLANPALTCVFLADAHEATPADDADSVPPQEPLFGSEPGSPSAVAMAVAFGQVLRDLGSKALDRLRARSVIYLHLAEEAVRGKRGCAVVRVDDPVAGGPISVDQLRTWLANDRVTVRPVLDPTDAEPVDGYEIPLHLREAVRLLQPYETFPYGTSATGQADLDHTRRYVPIDEGGPPGQTALTNLGPLSRRHHLAKTFDGFTVEQPAVGAYYWRTPTGHWYRVDHRGTRPLGRHAGEDRPAAVDLAERLDPTGMSSVEVRLRDLVIRHAAA